VASPMPANTTELAAIAMISDGICPSRRVSTGFTSPPITLPTADAVQSSP
jgi:hypothetical protein